MRRRRGPGRQPRRRRVRVGRPCAPTSPSTRSTGRATSCWRTAGPSTCGPIRPDDGDKLQDLYSRLSDESLYLRFFSPVPAPTARQLEQISEIDYDRRFSLVAELGDDIVAVARYDRTGADEGGAAEVAFSVQDDQQGRGLGSILLEHLAAVARDAGHPALRSVDDAEQPQDAPGVLRRRLRGRRASFDAGTVEVSFDIEPTPESVAVQREREQISEARSMGRMLAPRTIAVVGAGRRRGDDRPRGAPQPARGRVHRPRVPGEPHSRRRSPACGPIPTVADVPDRVDLAVVTVPAAAVPEVVEDCARARACRAW